jgi:hypothetical protein
VEKKSQDAGRRRVKETRRHRCHPDGGPTPYDRLPPRTARKRRPVAHTRTKQHRALRRVGTTRRSPATDMTGSCGGRGGRVRRWRGSVDLVSKIKRKKKVKERAKNHPADDTKARSLLQRRQLEMNNPAKQKKNT